MIDNNHLVYVGVLTFFLIGPITVALIGSLLLAAGFAVPFTVRFYQRPSRRKP
jgi:pilus assembly protein TadC